MDWDSNGDISFGEFVYAFTKWVDVDGEETVEDLVSWISLSPPKSSSTETALPASNSECFFGNPLPPEARPLRLPFPQYRPLSLPRPQQPIR